MPLLQWAHMHKLTIKPYGSRSYENMRPFVELALHFGVFQAKRTQICTDEASHLFQTALLLVQSTAYEFWKCYCVNRKFEVETKRLLWFQSTTKCIFIFKKIFCITKMCIILCFIFSWILFWRKIQRWMKCCWLPFFGVTVAVFVYIRLSKSLSRKWKYHSNRMLNAEQLWTAYRKFIIILMTWDLLHSIFFSPDFWWFPFAEYRNFRSVSHIYRHVIFIRCSDERTIKLTELVTFFLQKECAEGMRRTRQTFWKPPRARGSLAKT